MGRTRRRIAGRRLVAAVLLVCLLGAVLAAVGVGSADGQTVSDNADAASSVRIAARKLADGKVEFALQVGADRQWLPPTRNFPYGTATVGRWLYASWYTVGDPTTPLSAGSPAATTGVGPTD